MTVNRIGVGAIRNLTVADGPSFTRSINERGLIGVVGRRDFNTLGSHYHIGALETATMQTMVARCARHHVERTLVGFAARIEHAACLGGIGSLHAFSSPVFGPRKASIAIGILVDDGVLLVVSGLERIVDRFDNGIARNRSIRNNIDIRGVFLNDLRGDALRVALAVFGLIEVVCIIDIQRIVGFIRDFNGSDSMRGDFYFDLDGIRRDSPLLAFGLACNGRAHVGSIGDLRKIVRGI